jgi:hypothetical protein
VWCVVILIQVSILPLVNRRAGFSDKDIMKPFRISTSLTGGKDAPRKNVAESTGSLQRPLQFVGTYPVLRVFRECARRRVIVFSYKFNRTSRTPTNLFDLDLWLDDETGLVPDVLAHFPNQIKRWNVGQKNRIWIQTRPLQIDQLGALQKPNTTMKTGATHGTIRSDGSRGAKLHTVPT